MYELRSKIKNKIKLQRYSALNMCVLSECFNSDRLNFMAIGSEFQSRGPITLKDRPPKLTSFVRVLAYVAGTIQRCRAVETLEHMYKIQRCRAVETLEHMYKIQRCRAVETLEHMYKIQRCRAVETLEHMYKIQRCRAVETLEHMQKDLKLDSTFDR